MVDRRRRQLLAGATFAEDQDGQVGGGDFADQFGDILQPDRAAEDGLARRQRFLQVHERRTAGIAADLAGDVLDEGEQVVHDHRLEDILIGAHFYRSDRIVDRAIAGQHDYKGLRPQPFDLAQQVDAADPGHAHVGDDDIELVVSEELQPLEAAAGGSADDVFQLEHVLQGAKAVLLVIDDQNLDCLVHNFQPV